MKTVYKNEMSLEDVKVTKNNSLAAFLIQNSEELGERRNYVPQKLKKLHIFMKNFALHSWDSAFFILLQIYTTPSLLHLSKRPKYPLGPEV